MAKRAGKLKQSGVVNKVPRALATEIDRPRLQKLLKAHSGAKLIALLAPSGYGKTTLLAQYTRGSRRSVAWVNLGADDAEVRTFALDVAAAIGRVLPDLALTRWEKAVQNKVSPDGLAKSLAADLEDSERDLWIVLDETQFLGADAGRWLERFVRALPEGHQVLLTGFDGAALPLTRLIAAGEAVVLGLNELRFTVQETKALLKTTAISGDADDLTRSLEGWCAGVALAITSGGSSGTPEMLIADCLERLPEALRSVLPEASVADTWSEVSFAELGVVMPSGWLRDVMNSGLPLRTLEPNVYRPHDLLRTVLDARLRLRSERYTELHNAVAGVELAVGRKLSAIRHFQRAGNQEAAFRVASEAAAIFGNRSEFKLVRELLEGFPEDQMPFDLLMRWVQALNETGDAPRADVILRGLYADGKRDAFMLYQLAILEYRQGHYEAQLARVAEGLAAQPSARVEASLRFVESAGLEAMGRFKEGLSAALEAVRIAERLNDLPLLTSALTVLASSYAENGMRLECERTFLRAIELTERLEMEQRLLPNLNNLACHLSDWGRLQDALGLLQRGLEIAEHEPNFWLPILLGTRGVQHLRLGAFDLAVADFERGLEWCKQFDLDAPAFNYRLWQAEALRLLGRLPEAERCLEENRVQSIAAEAFFQSRLAAMDGVCALSGGNFAAAATYFAQVNSEHLDWWDQPRLKAYLAELARIDGKLTETSINELCGNLDTLGHDQPLLLDQTLLKDLYEACLAGGWHAERFQRALYPSSVFVSPSQQLELRVTTLGSVSVTSSGDVLHLPLAKSEELLVWLGLHGSGTRDALVTALWDGSRSANSVQYFKVAVRQLRLALKQHLGVTFDPLPFEAGVYRLHPRLELRLDAKAFHFTNATNLNDAGQLLDSYCGEFMPGFDSEWILETRARLHENALTLHLEHAGSLSTSQPREAVRFYNRVLQLDETNEAAFEGLTRIYSSLGDVGNQRLLETMKFKMLSREYSSQRVTVSSLPN
jgi:LuxR family transcriptional regulator, maltose regulon positive regulatory protein